MPGMPTRTAACQCEQLQLSVTGDPMWVSMCHCLACQRRSGGPYAVQARFPAERVEVRGSHRVYVRRADEDGEERAFHFCPECGSTVFYTTADAPEVIAVPVGAFADPAFPAPSISHYDARRHGWVALPDGIERTDVWEQLRPLYEAGRYDEVADRGRAAVEEHPGWAELAYNVACCESLAGRTDDAIAHLRLAVERSEGLRELAATDSDLDAIRGQPAFRELVG
jgi:hypothetical protein